MVVAHPQLRWRYGLVHIHPANVRLGREQIIDHLSRFDIEPRHMIIRHSARPGIGAVVEHRVIGRGIGRRNLPFLELPRLGIEHADILAAIFRKP